MARGAARAHARAMTDMWSARPHVAITGASSGIGAALARELGQAGARLTLVARRRELLDRLADGIPDALALAHDLVDPARATGWLAAAEARHGAVDIMVHNAGMENTGPCAEGDPAVGMRVLSLNLLTPLTITRHLLPAMIARGAGMIVDVASMAAITPTALQTWYAASKAGLAAFSEALRAELQDSGVHVLTVYPGPVTTAMAEAAYQKFGGRKGWVARAPEGKPDELARIIRRAMESRAARVIYPRVYHTARLLPWLARRIVDAAGPRPHRR